MVHITSSVEPMARLPNYLFHIFLMPAKMKGGECMKRYIVEYYNSQAFYKSWAMRRPRWFVICDHIQQGWTE